MAGTYPKDVRFKGMFIFSVLKKMTEEGQGPPYAFILGSRRLSYRESKKMTEERKRPTLYRCPFRKVPSDRTVHSPLFFRKIFEVERLPPGYAS